MRTRMKVAAAVSAAAALTAVGGGIASATQSSGDSITACAKTGDGLLRVVATTAECRDTETALSWPAEGAKSFRFVKSAPPGANVEITAIGTGPVGFPGEGESETELFRFSLPAGKYLLTSTVGVFKNSGQTELLCYVVTPNDFAATFLRGALGTDPGYTRLETMHSDGLFDWPGGEGRLGCIQDGSRRPPSGENPFVFYSTVIATEVASITSTRIP